ncbi:MAG: hypothetical protein JWL87_637 [Candidatus Adlerbacteria bacterium]|nr:hypothetical protein [Candidatus Adlerbacteria bacterium]
MKKLATLVAASLLLAPSFVLAQTEDVRPNLKAEMHASTTMEKLRPAALQKLGPAIRNVASTTRAELKGTASTTREVIKKKLDAIHALVEQKRGTMQERAKEAREKAHERFGDRVEKLVGQVSDRLASTSVRLASIADRAEDRIGELEAGGRDMDASIALLAEARASIDAADDKIISVNATLQAAMATTTPKAEIPAVRSAVKAAEDALKLAKDDLGTLLRSIRAEATATSTTQTTITR